MDSEKQKINITPKLLSDLEVKNIFYKLNQINYLFLESKIKSYGIRNYRQQF